MIPVRFTPILVPLVMTFFVACCVSFLLTLNSVGPIPGFVALWLKNWMVAWAFAFPAGIFALPLARRIVAMLTA
ncbi:MAG: DUF2798 domain-containing protein [Paracraurococcus sp.]|jgi:hypothetical protein